MNDSDKILEDVRRMIGEQHYDVFVCYNRKDVGIACDVSAFLNRNGYEAFIDCFPMAEIGIGRYRQAVGEVIAACPMMVVIVQEASDLEKPQMNVPWQTFANEITIGRKVKSGLMVVLSPDIDPQALPDGLKGQPCFTTENYSTEMLPFLGKKADQKAMQLRREVENTYERIRMELDRTYLFVVTVEANSLIRQMEHDRQDLLRRLDLFDSTPIPQRQQLDAEVSLTLMRWKDGLYRIHEMAIEKENRDWELAQKLDTAREYKSYLAHYPDGLHREEAALRLNECQDGPPNEYTMHCPSIPAAETFSPSFMRGSDSQTPTRHETFLERLFGRRTKDVFSSVFAPAEVRPESHLLVQVFIHLQSESEKVMVYAKEPQSNATRRDYSPLMCELKKGDKVDVIFSINGRTLLMSETKSIIWRGSFSKCSFDYFVPGDLDVSQLSCMAQLTVNGIPVGEMRFITEIVNSPRELNPEVISHRYKKVFISYAHEDESQVKSFHEGLRLFKIEHFFDRASLEPGDYFSQVIEDYINSADLFVLFWSENASKSEYVKKEREQALRRAKPQQYPNTPTLSIYPMSIEPRAELPSDMKPYYHFGVM